MRNDRNTNKQMIIIGGPKICAIVLLNYMQVRHLLFSIICQNPDEIYKTEIIAKNTTDQANGLNSNCTQSKSITLFRTLI